VIGKGGFGRVWKVSEKKSRKVLALKVIDKARVISKKSVQSIMNEKEILSRLCEEESEFLVNMKGAFQDRDNCYLLMDYLEAGDLRYYINRNYTFSEDQIRTPLPMQASSSAASWKDSTISTSATSSIATLNQKTSSLIATATLGSPTSVSPGTGRLRIRTKPVARPVIWLQKSSSGRIIPSAQTSTQWE
jgi:hypothetical protein